MTLRLETFKNDEMIFDCGDFGDKFFIILSGAVGVEIPVVHKLTP
jgi:CRP-like cAMP-binding protein